VVNIDEAALIDSNHSRRSWAKTNTPNSSEECQISPRISIIAGIDTNGEVYVALTQVNTNTNVMKLYMWHLVQILQKQDKDFRKSVVF
jgi:hypothetical protein